MSQSKSTYIILAIAIFYVVFFPTSISGVIFGNMWMIRNLLGIFIALWVCKINNIDPNAKKNGILTIVVLSIFTLIGTVFANNYWGELRIAWASVSGFLPSCILWCISFENLSISGKNANRILIILSAILIVWGWGLVFTVSPIENFTIQWYSSLHEDMLTSMMERGKPVMSFSTHSVSAFFITLFFYLHCVALRHGFAGPINYVCMLLLFLLVIPMTSNTAMIMLAVMASLFMWSSKSNITKAILVLFCALVFYYYWDNGFISSYIDSIVNATRAEAHGLESRYGSQMYNGNIEIISSIGGIGFLRSNTEFFRMIDSGFIYLMTQGNLLVLCLVYLLRYKFYKRNQIQHVWLTILLFLLLEFITASAYISPKIVFAEILVILFINSFVADDNGIIYTYEQEQN